MWPSVESDTIAGVKSDGGRPVCEPGQESRQPGRRTPPGDEAAHQLRLDEGRREEVEPGRLPGAGVVGVAGRTSGAAAADDGVEQASVAGRGRASSACGRARPSPKALLAWTP